ncbi:terminase family protein [Ferrimicrobium sp.]|uniref:phage terminase large subunit family protein n=1 Tax=Ferrimicrobium sp. TaxID=2926050 RepID=UPI00261C0627|nr:terminase family protein [Ferrimicrobium sp.]
MILSQLANLFDPVSVEKDPRRLYCAREVCDGKPHDGLGQHARSVQRLPKEWNRVMYMRGGRGSGKTFAGSLGLAVLIVENWDTPSEWAVVAPTAGDARSVCMESITSGLLLALGATIASGGTILDPGPWIESYSKTTGTLHLKNGGIVYSDGADDGAYRIQGKNLAAIWADEVGLWKKWDAAWNESIKYAVRKTPAKIIATGTPKKSLPARKLVLQLLNDDVNKGGKTVCRQLLTSDNADNLDPETMAEFMNSKGTALERQELMGELLEDVEGALWSSGQLDALRVQEGPELVRLVIGVDPAGSAQGDTTGIVVAGKDRAGHVYILEDRTGQLAPHSWGGIIQNLAEKWKADKIIAEGNFGGDMVRETLKAGGVTLPIEIVHASRGKRPRAEPVAALAGDPSRPETWEGKRFHIVGSLPELEDEITTWTPEDNYSPGRLDALVWAVNGLGVLGPDPVAAWLGYAEKRLAAQKT